MTILVRWSAEGKGFVSRGKDRAGAERNCKRKMKRYYDRNDSRKKGEGKNFPGR